MPSKSRKTGLLTNDDPKQQQVYGATVSSDGAAVYEAAAGAGGSGERDVEMAVSPTISSRTASGQSGTTVQRLSSGGRRHSSFQGVKFQQPESKYDALQTAEHRRKSEIPNKRFPVGVCFSGGGIRSAAFQLGVSGAIIGVKEDGITDVDSEDKINMRYHAPVDDSDGQPEETIARLPSVEEDTRLREHGLPHDHAEDENSAGFDYLSTVSGGGYTGASLIQSAIVTHLEEPGQPINWRNVWKDLCKRMQENSDFLGSVRPHLVVILMTTFILNVVAQGIGVALSLGSLTRAFIGDQILTAIRDQSFGLLLFFLFPMILPILPWAIVVVLQLLLAFLHSFEIPYLSRHAWFQSTQTLGHFLFNILRVHKTTGRIFSGIVVFFSALALLSVMFFVIASSVLAWGVITTYVSPQARQIFVYFLLILMGLFGVAGMLFSVKATRPLATLLLRVSFMLIVAGLLLSIGAKLTMWGLTYEHCCIADPRTGVAHPRNTEPHGDLWVNGVMGEDGGKAKCEPGQVVWTDVPRWKKISQRPFGVVNLPFILPDDKLVWSIMPHRRCEEYSMFDIGNVMSWPEVQIVLVVILLIWVANLQNSHLALHDIYRLAIASAFFKPRKETGADREAAKGAAIPNPHQMQFESISRRYTKDGTSYKEVDPTWQQMWYTVRGDHGTKDGSTVNQMPFLLINTCANRAESMLEEAAGTRDKGEDNFVFSPDMIGTRMCNVTIRKKQADRQSLALSPQGVRPDVRPETVVSYNHMELPKLRDASDGDKGRCAKCAKCASWFLSESDEGCLFDTTLSQAIAVSGAAVATQLGEFDSISTRVVLSLLHINLGKWAPNPNPICKCINRTSTVNNVLNKIVSGIVFLGYPIFNAADAMGMEFAEKPLVHSKSIAVIAATIWVAYSMVLYWPFGPAKIGTFGARIKAVLSLSYAYRLFGQMMGRNDDGYSYVFLSDGGHLDNTGIIPLLQRRLRTIHVFDAGEDGEASLSSLSGILAMLRDPRMFNIKSVKICGHIEDLMIGKGKPTDPEWRTHGRCVGIRVTWDKETFPEQASKTKKKEWERTEYKADDIQANTTDIWYTLTTMTGSESEQIKLAHLVDPAFPHHSTGNQFMTRDVFELYRKLGHLSARELDRFKKAALPDCFRDEYSDQKPCDHPEHNPKRRAQPKAQVTSPTASSLGALSPLDTV